MTFVPESRTDRLLATPGDRSIRFAIADDTTAWSASFTLRGNSRMPLGCIVKLSIAIAALDPGETVALARELCASDQPVYGYLSSSPKILT